MKQLKERLFWRGVKNTKPEKQSKEVLYKKIPIIPVIILALLAAAWVLRWDYGPTQNFENCLRVQYIHDNWTGQDWLKLYGTLPEVKRAEPINWWGEPNYTSKWNDWANNWAIKTEPWQGIIRGTNIKASGTISFAGETYPYFSSIQIKTGAKKIMNSGQGISKKEELQQIINKAKEKKSENSAGHTTYLRMYDQVFHNLHKGSSKDYTWQKLTPEQMMQNLNANVIYEKDIESKIPSPIIQQCKAWRDADKLIRKAELEISDLSYWSIGEAKNELAANARSLNKKVALAWWGVVIVVFGYMVYQIKKKYVN